jgi:hypothetical protein
VESVHSQFLFLSVLMVGLRCQLLRLADLLLGLRFVKLSWRVDVKDGAE